MGLKIALAGNPNCGKTTLFNALTGSNQYVGNWPGVTVEKKEGKLKKHDDVTVTDLPGIYSLSPYTLEEVVARNYLIDERPDVILNIVDGTNLERNLYLTTQIVELGIPVVVAVNMMDVVKKNGDRINVSELSRELGCKVVEISALKGTGIYEAAETAIDVAKNSEAIPHHAFSGPVEHAIAHIEEAVCHEMEEERQRWYAIKLFERDQKIIEKLDVEKSKLEHIETDIVAAEKELDDDSESIITNERYVLVGEIIKSVLTKKNRNKLSVSDRIDRVITNRWLGLPIFAAVMFLVYFVSVTTVGSLATDWANDGVFGDGWHLFGIGSKKYEQVAEEYGNARQITEAYLEFTENSEALKAIDNESEEFDFENACLILDEVKESVDGSFEFEYTVRDEETLEDCVETATGQDVSDAVKVLKSYEFKEPDPAEYGVWVPGVPVLVEGLLNKMNVSEEGAGAVVRGVVLDGIVAGVGAVLGFVPQILILFVFLAFLESCSYMARVAFVLDRFFRKFGLSGKSFIPLLIGSGCGVPGIMASRTIENEKDRRMTIMTTTFIPCGAKLPFIALIAGAIFGGAPWVAPSAYFLGILAVICSGIILKKTRLFNGEPAPFIMELPSYHWPTFETVIRSTWERGWSFTKKAGTIIMLSTVVIWFLSFFGFADGHFGMLSEDQLDMSILARIGKAIAWIFVPQGWGNWQATVASITGLVAKENIVGTLGILYGAGDGTFYQNMAQAFSATGLGIAGYSFLVFNLLCAPCFAAMGAIKREMNSRKWFWIAVGYQCGFAYLVSLVVYRLGKLFNGGGFDGWVLVAILLVIAFVYFLCRKNKLGKVENKRMRR